MTRHFGDNIRFLRRKKNISQELLASELEITRNRVVSYERGSAEPRLVVLVRMSLYFEVTVDDLLSKDLSITEELAAASRKFTRLSVKEGPLEELDEVNLSFDDPEALEEFIHKSKEVEQMYGGFKAYSQLRDNSSTSNGEGNSVINRENLLYLLEHLLETNKAFIASILHKK